MQFVWLTVCSPILYCKTLNMICLFDSYGASVFILYRISCVSRLGKGKIIRPSSEEMKDADTALATWRRRGKQNTVITEWFWSLSMKSTVARCLCLCAIYLLCKQVVKNPWWFCFENTLIECLCYGNGDDCNCCVISTGELFCYFFLRQLFCY